MKKVLHLTAGNLYGGIETFLTTLARLRHLAPEMESEFGLCFRGRPWDELAATGAAVHDLGPVRISRPITVWRARRRLVRLLQLSLPDAVVVHGSWPHVVFAPVVRRAGIRLVHLVHGESTGRHWLERLAARTPPDLVVANSRFTAGSAGYLFPETRVEVWHCPVARPSVGRSARAEVRSEFGTDDGTLVILQASRLERWKGHAVHIAALGLLRDIPGWECWIAGGAQKKGETELLEELKSAAEQNGIADRVRFLGQRADIPRVMAAADVYCQPNTGPEPFGIAFVEALYAALPVVTSDFGGAAEIMNDTCGVLIPPGKTVPLAESLRKLIQNPVQRRALGAAGPERAELLCAPHLRLEAALEIFLGRANFGT